MTSDEILSNGSLAFAVDRATDEVRKHPADSRKRTFLFELLCYSGEWDRAGKQLDVLAQAGAEQDAAVSRYRKILQGESKRRAVFHAGALPGLPPNFPEWLSLHLEALTLLHAGSPEQARESLEKAADQWSSLECTVDGAPAAGFRDADDRFGPILEVFTGAEYSWIPFEMIQSLTISEPRNFRDLLYVPAMLNLHIGPMGEVFVPALYPDSGNDGDDRIRLGKTTVWNNDQAGLSIGSGQRILGTDAQDWPLLEIRLIEWAKPDDHV